MTQHTLLLLMAVALIAAHGFILYYASSYMALSAAAKSASGSPLGPPAGCPVFRRCSENGGR
jgi:hypothetical protein